ncbi:helicase-related protein [Georgenia sp. EYE_87]|uniref:helicase-related protein n=1 Tax=Georgenia sp. EYE_87 TaxID=2853448 RepID=UPI0020046551|nr:helicase-related protein [Georgenia sp. EYE_87]
MTTTYAAGSLVRTRGREWVVLPDSVPDFLVLRPLGGGRDDIAGVFPAIEAVTPATFPPPSPSDLGDATSAALLRTALRIGFRSSAGPFRSVAGLAVEPRAYQYVPLMLALRQDVVRLLVADDVGIGKTVEAGLIAAELLAQGAVQRLAVLCSPALAEQWQHELREKFNIDAELVLTSTVRSLERGLMMDESLFDKYPFVVVSTDFIKSPQRRHEFLNRCPELVIVDEAHTAVADDGGSGRTRHQRYELLQGLAKDPDRHLVLVTATPHSGKDAGFRNLVGLLNPALASLDLERQSDRELLAKHFVQRRRADIRTFLDEETAFPADRESREAPYALSPAYQALFEKVLAYAREQVRDTAGGTVHQRVRWWSALALLRTIASSPHAAAATLRTRAASAEAVDVAEADALGRAGILDTADDEALESLDAIPGADTTGEASTSDPRHRRLLTLAREAEALAGPAQDRKLATLTKEVKALLADGYDPIVFCRYIDTAEYVAEHLSGALGKGVDIASVTGTLPPSEREQRIRDLTATDARHVLVATDCLSEGVNLQDAFQAVVHYDLAWNPTRHEQREGRVDRFGQRANIVRAVTIYGTDNRIDGIVLDTLIRKHRAITKATGVSVPVPDQSDGVIQALLEGLLLRGQDPQQLTLDLGLTEKIEHLHRDWESAAEKEKRSRTRYAQRSIHPGEVAAEVAAVRAALGTHDDVAAFTDEVLRALGASVTPTKDGFTAVTTTLTAGVRDALPLGHAEPLPFHAQLPVKRGHALLSRTDPTVEALARHVLDSALDRASDPDSRPATRAGVMRTTAVTTRTTLLLVRFRFHLQIPTATGTRPLVAEDAQLLAFQGPPDHAAWLDDAAVSSLLAATPGANMPADQAATLAERVIDTLPAVEDHLNATADDLAATLLQSHRRVRAGAGAARRGLVVTAQKPTDILGVYIYLPTAGGGAS